MIRISCLNPNRGSSKTVISKMVKLTCLQTVFTWFWWVFWPLLYIIIVKLLETWWFWFILGKETHIYSNQKQPDFHQKITMDPNVSIKPCVCCLAGSSKKAPRIWFFQLSLVLNIYLMWNPLLLLPSHFMGILFWS